MRKTLRKEIEEEIERRAHTIEGQGDNIWMVLIRMDEILTIVRKFRRQRSSR